VSVLHLPPSLLRATLPRHLGSTRDSGQSSHQRRRTRPQPGWARRRHAPPGDHGARDGTPL